MTVPHPTCASKRSCALRPRLVARISRLERHTAVERSLLLRPTTQELGETRDAGGRHGLQRLDLSKKQACLLPRLKASVKCPHAFEAAVQQYARQTRARGLAWSSAIQNDLLAERHRVDVLLQNTRRDA
jgi:hypothetical protein